ncbi:hypothetical protein GCM10028819_48150 [Spirosoma humi]
MRLSSLQVIALLTVSGLLGCDVNAIGPYYNLGKFTSRTIAEQKTLAYLASRYDQLSATNYEKVKYTFDPSKPNTGTQHAIWYSKTNRELRMEVDLGSGPCAMWSEIDQAVLNQIVQANQGMSIADSLGKPKGVSYIDCVGR